MRKLVVFEHISIDGFVAGPNGEMDWIKVDEEMFDYAASQTELADAALYGRITYDMMEGYWPTAGDQPNASKHDKEHSQWYNHVTKNVISNTLKGRSIPKTAIISGAVHEQVLELKKQPGKNILLFGSPSAVHLLMAHNLIDEYWLFVNPIMLGNGIPLFKNIQERISLTLLETNVFSSGVVMLHYQK